MKTGSQLLSWSALCNGEVWKNKDCKDWLTDFDFTSLFTQSPVSQDEMRSRSEPALLASAAIAAKERKGKTVSLLLAGSSPSPEHLLFGAGETESSHSLSHL